MTWNPPDNADRDDVMMIEIELGSPNVPGNCTFKPIGDGREQGVCYRDALQRNNPNLNFETRDNPIWETEGWDDVSEDDEPPEEDDEPPEEDDPTCPMILLTAAEKRLLREPWPNALIIKISRFRALANPNLNMELEPIMEREEIGGDKEDFPSSIVGTVLDNGIAEDFALEEK
ncbi:hypothetical protein Cgig2_005311 [Carnegiea gigantea]|uniref:Uncharacterized protein n=1 Tax=Carnegiea gigantea TaxID=171969 RepID=A0A9Q1GK40_9CARY|nr:hypothetical protein Cgig2_005311 [Carnegiea gigantea]